MIRTPKIIIGSNCPKHTGVRIQPLRPAQGKNVAMKLYMRDETRLAVVDAAKLPALLRKT
jgi:hypothetical protein